MTIIPGASRVSALRVLGVTISSGLGMRQHLDEVLATCASSMYALRVLRSYGLPPSAIHEVARMTTVASFMYASPAWWKFTLARDRPRVEQLLWRMIRSSRLPEIRSTNYSLRPMAHEFSLPQKDDKNFLPRLLFNNIY